MSHDAWRALRARLGGPDAPPVSPRDLAHVAVHGEVVALIAHDDPDVAAEAQADLEARVFGQMHVARVARRLGELLAPWRTCLLKGSAAAWQVYDDPDLRFSRDVDVLVHDGDFEAILDTLRADGWTDAVGQGFADSHGARPWQWALAREEGPVRVACDVHRSLSRPGRFAIDPAEVLVRGLKHRKAPLRLIHPDDGIVHGAVHAAVAHYRVPLKSWVDIARLAAHRDADLHRLIRRARRWRVTTATWAGLHVAQRWLNAPVPADVLDALAPRPATAQKLTELLVGDGQFPVAEDASDTRLDLLLCDDVTAAGLWALHGTRRFARLWARRISRPLPQRGEGSSSR